MTKKAKNHGTEKNRKITDRYDSVLLEGIRSDFKMVAESVEALQGKVQSLENRVDLMAEAFHAELLDVKYSLHGRMIEAKQDLRAYLVEGKQEIVMQVSEKVDRFGSRLSKCEREIDCLKASHPQ